MMLSDVTNGALGSFAGQGISGNGSHSYCVWILSGHYGKANSVIVNVESAVNLNCFTVRALYCCKLVLTIKYICIYMHATILLN